MKETLTSVLNTLMQIETKGNGTILMGTCLQAINQLIPKVDELETRVKRYEERETPCEGDSCCPDYDE